jgi:hypothetical protein
MLEMAGILYDVDLEDDDVKDVGTYFDGIFWMLYPTAFIEERKPIQWNLVKDLQINDRNGLCRLRIS